jgi:hypothetical protein
MKNDITHCTLLKNFVYHSVIVVSLIDFYAVGMWYHESPYDYTYVNI